jgi:hypothetical protein
MRGRPVRSCLLRLWHRARRDRFCVLKNGVAFRATVLAQQVRSLSKRQFWGPQTSSMAPLPQHISTGYKRCSPLLLRMTLPPSLTRRSQLTQMACGRLGRCSAFIRALSSMTRTLPADSLLPNKSQPFSIVWADKTDSICDLPPVLNFLDNFTSKRYRTNATSSSPATCRSARWASNGAAAPSSLSSSSSLLQPPLPPHSAPAAVPASATEIFCGHPLSPRGPRRQPYKVRIFLFPLRFIRHGASF